MYNKAIYINTAWLFFICFFPACKKNSNTLLLLKPVTSIQRIDIAELKIARDLSALGIIGDNIYIFGGGTNTAEVFKTKTKQSSIIPYTLSDNNFDLSAAIKNDTIYIFGGGIDTIRTFNINQGILKLPNKLSAPRRAMSIVALRDSIYIFGGYDFNTTTRYDIIEILNTKTKAISTLTTKLKTPRAFAPTARVGDSIYIFGSNGNTTDAEVFDIKNQTTNIIPSVSIDNANGASAVALGDKIFIFGGFSGSNTTNKISMFDTKTQKLQTLSTTLSTKRANTSAVTMGDNIYIFGGYDGNNDVKTIEIFEAVRQ